MAASAETSQYERDLRSAAKEWKRSKDSAAKWSHGFRPLPGVSLAVFDEDDGESLKSRPGKKFSDAHRPFHKQTPNLVKLRRNWVVSATRMRSKIHAKSEIRDASDMTTSTTTAAATPTPPLLSPSYSPTLRRTLSISSSSNSATATPAGADLPSPSPSPSPYYSFDRADSPGRPLTLEVFVKKPTGRETERLVEREYEVLDGNGEAVRGRKARAVLRSGTGGGGGSSKTRDGKGGGGEEEEREGEGEDEGFEIV